MKYFVHYVVKNIDSKINNYDQVAIDERIWKHWNDYLRSRSRLF